MGFFKKTKALPFSFDALLDQTQILPPLKEFVARDGENLWFREYKTPSSNSNKIIIMVHGSGWHSQQFFRLAPSLSEIGKVYTPDLRGHGPQTSKRGDIKYIGQLEDDLADFILNLKKQNSSCEIVLLGHSSGGGLLIRFAGGKHSALVSNYVLVSPYIHPMAPVTRKNQQWARPSLLKLIGVSILDSLGIKTFNGSRIIQFNMPEKFRDGTETLQYSYRLLNSINPRNNYRVDISKISQSTLVLVGGDDEIFWPEKFVELFKDLVNVEVKIVPKATHLSVMVDPSVVTAIKNFLIRQETTSLA